MLHYGDFVRGAFFVVIRGVHVKKHTYCYQYLYLNNKTIEIKTVEFLSLIGVLWSFFLLEDDYEMYSISMSKIYLKYFFKGEGFLHL